MTASQESTKSSSIIDIIIGTLMGLFFTAIIVVIGHFIFTVVPRQRVAPYEANKIAWTEYYKKTERDSTPDKVLPAIVDQVTMAKQLQGQVPWNLSQNAYTYKYYGPEFLGWKIQVEQFEIPCGASSDRLPDPVVIRLYQNNVPVDQLVFNDWQVKNGMFVGVLDYEQVKLNFEVSFGRKCRSYTQVTASLDTYVDNTVLYKKYLLSQDNRIPYSIEDAIYVATRVEGRIEIPVFSQPNQSMVHVIPSSTRDLGWQIGAIYEDPEVWCGKSNPKVWIYLWNDAIPARPIVITDWVVSKPDANGIHEFASPIFLNDSTIEARFYISRTCDYFDLHVTLVPK